MVELVRICFCDILNILILLLLFLPWLLDGVDDICIFLGAMGFEGGGGVLKSRLKRQISPDYPKTPWFLPPNLSPNYPGAKYLSTTPDGVVWR